MRICIMANAGSEHTLRLTRYLVEEKHEVHLVSWKQKLDLPSDVHIHKLPTSKFPLLRELIWLFQTRRLIRYISPDIVDAHYITTNGFLAACSGFHPLVVTIWGSDLLIYPWNNPLWKFVAKYAINKADKIACLFSLELAKDELIKLGTDLSKVETYYLGVDTDEFKPIKECEEIRNNLGIDRSCPIVINPRGLAPEYDVETFIRAIPIVLNNIPQANFLILHNNKEDKKIEKLRSKFGLSESVKFIQRVSHSKMPYLLSAADIYVSASLTDGASNALLESMACEKAAIVSDIPANRYWINDGENGYLFPPGNHIILAEKIVSLLRDKEKRALFGRKCRRIIQDKAEHRIQMAKIENIYQALIEKHSED